MKKLKREEREFGPAGWGKRGFFVRPIKLEMRKREQNRQRLCVSENTSPERCV